MKFLILALLASLPPPARDTLIITPNFIVEAPNRPLALRVAYDAEVARQRVAEYWLGRRLKDWPVRVPVVVRVGAPKTNGTTRRFSRHVSLIEAWGPTEDDAEGVIPHEVCHAVINVEMSPDVYPPPWVHEGMAVAFEVGCYDYPKRYGDLVGHTSLADLFEMTEIPWFFNGDAFYGQAASVTLYIRDTFGPAKFWEFYQGVRSMGAEVASVVVLGVSLGDLDQNWYQSVWQLDSPFPKSLRGQR